MRRILPILMILLLAGGVAVAELPDDFSLETFETTIQAFADGVAASLPLNLAVGLNWSDSYIGQLPHFGVGLSVGGSTIPYESAKLITDSLGFTETLMSSEAGPFIEQYGLPLPAVALEGRLGGLILPFDVGVKFGTVPPDVELKNFVPGMTAEYLSAGLDVRMPIVREKGLIPEISIGGGYNIVDSTIGIGGFIDGAIDPITFDMPVGYNEETMEAEYETYTISMSDPAAEFAWTAQSLDMKAQLSKKLFIITPYIGAGASLGFGSAGGGLGADISIVGPDGGELTDAQIEELNQQAQEYAGLLGEDAPSIPEIDPQGFYLNAPMTAAWTFRAYGGMSINLLILKIDATVMTDFQGSYAVSLGTRIQL